MPQPKGPVPLSCQTLAAAVQAEPSSLPSSSAGAGELSPSHCPHPQAAPSLTHEECTSASLQRAVVLLSVIVIPVCDQKCFKTIFIVSSANSSLLAPYHNTNMTKVTTAKKITGADNYSLFGFVLFLSSVNGDSGYTKEQTCESKLPDSYQEDLVLSMCT